MRVSYRVTSALVIVSYALIIAIDSMVTVTPVPAIDAATEPGMVSFNMCEMWEQIPWDVRFFALAWTGTFIVLIVQGFRNRSVPRWIAAVCLLALAPVVNHNFWRVEQCYTPAGRVGFWVLISSVVLMCSHQLIQRPRGWHGS